MRISVAAALGAATLTIAACAGSDGAPASGDGTDAEATPAVEVTAEATETAEETTAEQTTQQTEERRVAQTGDTVQVHYRGTLDNGQEFDSSHGRDPLTFTVGEGQVIPGFDDAVQGLEVGESKTVRLEPGAAYGERRDDLVFDVPADRAPDGLSAGDQVQLSNGAPAVVVEVDDDQVTIDANHPLAGQPLTFDIELVGIQQ